LASQLPITHCKLHIYSLSHPRFNRFPQFAQAAFEEVISGFDANQLLWISKSIDERFEFAGRTELIARAADEKFRLRRSAQEIEIVGAVFFRKDGQAERDERADSVVGAGSAQSDGGAERKAGEDYRKREFTFEPVKGGAHIFDFADAIRVLAFAQSGASEIEAKHGKSEAVKRFHGVEDDLVVERSAVERMRMTDDSGVRRGGRTGVEQSFQASGGSGEKEGTDAGGFGRHKIRVQQ
jgi:hypothetical protein